MLRDGKNTATIAQELELSIGSVETTTTRLLQWYQRKEKEQLIAALPSE
jgi:DNA-binding NarL/FixJ family response regulator